MESRWVRDFPNPSKLDPTMIRPILH